MTLTAHLTKHWLSYLIIALAAAIQLFLITRPLEFLIGNLLPDDAFYYFEIARNITLGQGSTFDGENLTNGYHPLWLLILLPLFAWLSVGGTTDLLPIHAALVLSVAFNIGTAFVLFTLLGRVTKQPFVRALALALFCLSPLILYETVNGLETSLSLLLLSLFFVWAVKAEETGRMHTYLFAGVFAGLAILARLDLAFYLVAFLLWLLLRHGIREGTRVAFVTGGIATLIVLPWLVFNISQFGTVLTSASGSSSFVHHALVVADNGESLYTTLKVPVHLVVDIGKAFLERLGASWLLFVTLGAALSAFLFGAIRFPMTRKHIPVLLALFVGFVLLFLANAGVRFVGRSWYFVSFTIFFAVLLAWTLEIVLARYKRVHLAGFALLMLMAGSFIITWHYEFRQSSESQHAMYKMALYVNEHLPADTRVGVFNAGITGYFSHAHIINLDGLVNNAAYAALRQRALWSYIRDEHIAYVSDFDVSFSYRYKPFLDIPDSNEGLEELYRVEGREGTRGGLALYRVRDVEED